jgi:uncharacterized protein (DUF1330 family)
MAIDPTGQNLAALAAEASDAAGPIVMVNLLKFSGDDGAEHYRRYAAEVQPHVASVGGSVLYAGDVSRRVIGEEGDVAWDAVVVVRYPSRAAFLAMISTPEYLEIHRHREAALTSAELLATEPWPGMPELL